MKTLEEFWYGNIEPSEYDAFPGKEYKEALRLVTRNEEKLQATMTDEQKELECLVFQSSFRLGARIMLEVMAE